MSRPIDHLRTGRRYVRRRGGLYDQVVRELDRRDDWTTAADLAGLLHISVSYCRELLADAITAGLVEQDWRGRSAAWRIIRQGNAAGGRPIEFRLTPAQARQVIQACIAQEQGLTDAPYVRGSEQRLRALHNARVAMEKSLPTTEESAL